MAEHSFQVLMPNLLYFLTIHAWAPLFCKSQGQPQKGLLHIFANVCVVAMALGKYNHRCINGMFVFVILAHALNCIRMGRARENCVRLP